MKPLSIPAAVHVRIPRPGRPVRSTRQCTGIRWQAPGTAQPAKDEYRTEDMAP